MGIHGKSEMSTRVDIQKRSGRHACRPITEWNERQTHEKTDIRPVKHVDRRTQKKDKSSRAQTNTSPDNPVNHSTDPAASNADRLADNDPGKQTARQITRQIDR